MTTTETFATGLVRPKTTALFFDKLWVPNNLKDPFGRSDLALLNVPEALRLKSPRCVREFERSWVRNVGHLPYDSAAIEAAQPFLLLEQELDRLLSHDMLAAEDQRGPSTDNRDRPRQRDIVDELLDNAKTFHRNSAIASIVKEYSKDGIELTPIFLQPKQFEDYNLPMTGEGRGLTACIDFFPDVVEDRLSWEQVVEFRRDRAAKSKLRRFRRWFNLELLKKSDAEISDTLAAKLEDYGWALKKHGIETAVGGATSIVAFAASPDLADMFLSSNTALAAGLAIGAGVVAWVGNKTVERVEISRAEIAYIYEVDRLVS